MAGLIRAAVAGLRRRPWRAARRTELARAPQPPLRVCDFVAAPPAAVTAAAAALDLPAAEIAVGAGRRPRVVMRGLAGGTLVTIEQVPRGTRRRGLRALDTLLRELAAAAVRISRQPAANITSPYLTERSR